MAMLGEQSPEQLIKHLADLAEGDALSRVVVSAQIDADGRLSKVGGIDAKLAALFGESPFVVRARTGQFPPRAVGIAQDQTELLADAEIDLHRKALALPRLCFQETFAGLVADLRVQQSQREGFVPKRFVEALQHKYKSDAFKGRRWLFEHIQGILEAHKNGLVVLEAGPGFGKTAFLLELIRQYGGSQLGPAWVLGWHILRRDHRDWLPTATIASQLEWQLRDRLLMPLPSGESKAVTSQTAPAVLRQVLEEAKEKLKTGDQKLLMVIDGLDEAFGSNTPVGHDRDQRWMLQDLFPNPLPDGVFILLTSRPGEHLEQFGHRSDLVIIDPENPARADLREANQQDLREYLTTRITEYGEAHTAFEAEIQSVVERMVAGCEGAFFVAEWFGRKETLDRRDLVDGPTNFERWCEPSAKLPSGIDEMLGEDWRYKRGRLQQAGHEAHAAYAAHLPVIATALALWHDLGTKPTDALIEDMIHGAADAASRHDPTAPRRVGKRLLTSDITPDGVEAVLEQLADWCEAPGGPEAIYVFRHSRIPELILETLVKPDGGPRLVRQVHGLLGWSAARWERLQGDSRTVALRNLLPHLIATAKDTPGVAKQLADTLLDYTYLVAALGADPKDRSQPLMVNELAAYTNESVPLVAQVDSATGEATRLLAGTLELSDYALNRNPQELPTQLHGRLKEFDNASLQVLLAQAEQLSAFRWLRPVQSTLTSPGGALLRRLPGRLFTGRVAFHPDGCSAFVSDGNGIVTVDLASGKLRMPSKSRFEGVVLDFAVSHSLQYAVLACASGILRLWNIESLTWGPTLVGHSDEVKHLAMHWDGIRVVSASRDHTLRVWDVRNGRCLAVLNGHLDGVTHVVLHADGRRAISASFDGTVRVWDLDLERCVNTLEGHVGGVTHVQLHADKRRLLSSSGDKTLRLWDLESGRCIATLCGHTHVVTHFVLHADERRAVSASRDKTVRVWDLDRAQCLFVLEGHASDVTYIALHPDRVRVVSASKDGTLRLWNIDTGQCLATLKGHGEEIRQVSLHPDGLRAVSHSFGCLVIWNLDSGLHHDSDHQHTDEVTGVVLHSDGSCALSASGDGTIRIWDHQIGKCLSILTGHTSHVTHVERLPGSRRAISTSSDRTLRIWDLDLLRCVTVLEGHGSTVMHVAIHADGRRAVSASMDKTLRVWDIERGISLATLEGHAKSVIQVALHVDGRRAVSVSRDDTLRIWDIDRGTCLATLGGHKYVCGVAIHPDGQRAVSVGGSQLRAWDLNSGQCITMHKHNGAAHVKFLPDGCRTLSISRYCVVRVWDLDSGRCEFTLDGYRSELSALWCSEDGRHVVMGSRDGAVRVWDIETQRLQGVVFVDCSASAVALANDSTMLAVGDAIGRVHFFEQMRTKL